MRRTLAVASCVVVLVGLGLAGVTLGNGALEPGDAAIMVSPQMIVLAKVSGVTVHSNITATNVVSGSVSLNGVAPVGVWADDCGHLAARFAVADLALEPGEATLTLRGTYEVSGDVFTASDDVRVK